LGRIASGDAPVDTFDSIDLVEMLVEAEQGQAVLADERGGEKRNPAPCSVT